MNKDLKFWAPIYLILLIIFVSSDVTSIRHFNSIEQSIDRLIELKESQLLDQYCMAEPDQYEESIYNFTNDEIFMLAQLLCGEAGIDGDGEYDFEWQLDDERFTIEYYEISKVLCVVMNRVMAKDLYADNITDVLLQPGAFIVFPKNLKTTPSEEVIKIIKEWCDAYAWEYDNVQVIPTDHYWFSADGRGGNTTRNYI